MNSHNDENTTDLNQKKRTIRRFLDTAGVGLFFIMIGCLWILPDGMVHEDAWLIGMGVIIFTVNFIRYLYGIRIKWFWIVIGMFALAFGVSGVYGLDLPILQAVLICIGISIIMRPWRGYKYMNCRSMMDCWRREKRDKQYG